MSKSLDIIMAGIISGIVAFTTSQLGIAGTIIGAVIGSMLYQFMSHVFKDPIENVNTLKTQRVESSIFYVFPLVIILGIEIIYLLSSVYHMPGELFQSLETATGWNLFRTIGVGLIVMGVYPLLEPERIPPIYGVAVLGVGVVKLMAGFVDYNSPIVALYSPIFHQFSELISIILIAVLLYVIVALIQDSVNISSKEDPSFKEIE
ncbi:MULTISPECIES: hypothetical protein [Methanobacterium]|jgi:hypothetical protein|uniref:Uncharacterized protein n=1 Tax=Methanobacterium formicicum TaxID=2162 RepID=A0A089Z9X4_METFO|nr:MULTISPECIES: hypothetical protein [Methanobacterium]AIS31606.1 hypothetical protein BRM9_0788 [Methanobacterium formicicum]KUK75557.1 MAG: Uncharacterized protein XD90_0197 [Methanobacterium sp. 42_16]MBF4475825.1 hypothetical protein [Methanobacterium formicicum]MDD4810014.1 hypothetical protein [Methanobacterium formicicum]MDG3548027.1 hypothetical protein [Methanobacterium formicicum]